MVDKTLGIPIQAAIGGMTGAGNLGRSGNQNAPIEEQKDSRSWWEQHRPGIFNFDPEVNLPGLFGHSQGSAQPSTIINYDQPKPQEEEVKYGQQEAVAPRPALQRYRADSDSFIMQLFFGAESMNRNQNTIEQVEHDRINQQVAGQLLEQAAEPLEEDQLQSRQDAEQIANQIQSGVDADHIANQIVEAIDEEDWDEIDRIIDEARREGNTEMITGLVAMVSVLLGGMGFALIKNDDGTYKKVPLTQQQEEQISKAQEEAEPLRAECRRFMYFENGTLKESIICTDGEMHFSE